MTLTAVVASEWIKFRSLRSLVISLLAVLVATPLFGALSNLDAGDDGLDPLYSAFLGVNFGQVAVIVFGAMAVTSEYAGGGIRIALAAVPRRGLWFTAKTTVVGGCALAIGVVTGFATLALGSLVLDDPAVSPTSSAGARAALGCGIYLALMALLAAGLAAVVRSGVAVLAILVPLTLMLSFVLGDATSGVAGYLPDQAGRQVLHLDQGATIGPWTGLAVTAAWSAVALLAGWWSLRRRDA
ncbi:ABC transporter permease [Streptomyces tsukubensis]|uniref:ABC transporter permease n=1 Tax=Streptomyces tsukubensis TaxID=83656 RepID=A0A1V4A7B1_9ACTN|nr:ABC transporter permease [Streptomyces tsukubensis]OON77337.1 ABC transporter permease [Streptomyces tsukubensis]QFR92415.1 ABC transporter permease [Streptomyces tsukubensis]